MANTLLVLGNGFDLLCGLGSSFEDFLNSNEYAPIRKQIEQVDMALDEKIDCIVNHRYGSFLESVLLFRNKELTFWDLFFAVPYYYDLKKKERNWMDFEARMKLIIDDICAGKGDFYNIQNVVEKISAQPETIESDETRFMIILYLYIQSIINDFWDTAFIDDKRKSQLLGLLKVELKKFEKRFGRFIKSKQDKTASYSSDASRLLEELRRMNPRARTNYINTFNYSDIYGSANFREEIWHINGDWESPIFGVDYERVEAVDDEKYRFTKTFRRLELEGYPEYYPQKIRIDNVVVCGHSLNEQDYNYFFALFNQLGIGLESGNMKDKSVVFTYYAHGDVSTGEAKQRTLINVLKLFQKYNNEILQRKDFRLMDILHCSGFLRIQEIRVGDLHGARKRKDTLPKWKKLKQNECL